jgi:hypothetical protein
VRLAARDGKGELVAAHHGVGEGVRVGGGRCGGPWLNSKTASDSASCTNGQTDSGYL